jgi:hypothetical protein
MAKFKVITSNPSNEGKSFVTKINHTSTVATVFGDKTKSETYYVSGSKQLVADAEVEFNMDMFQVKEYPFDNPATGETLMLKWLHLK